VIIQIFRQTQELIEKSLCVLWGRAMGSFEKMEKGRMVWSDERLQKDERQGGERKDDNR